MPAPLRGTGPPTAPAQNGQWARPTKWARALAALPEDQRVTVVLVDGEGFDNVQAAEILDVAPGTVASRLSRARATMRRTLHEEER